MSWKLWLDDQFDDPESPQRHVPEGYIGAKSTKDAQHLVLLMGLPEIIDFDHDLGEEDNATIFIKWMIENYPLGPVPKYSIHSANPVGVKNIHIDMNTWYKVISL